jgi:hypothetical protein
VASSERDRKFRPQDSQVAVTGWLFLTILRARFGIPFWCPTLRLGLPDLCKSKGHATRRGITDACTTVFAVLPANERLGNVNVVRAGHRLASAASLILNLPTFGPSRLAYPLTSPIQAEPAFGLSLCSTHPVLLTFTSPVLFTGCQCGIYLVAGSSAAELLGRASVMGRSGRSSFLPG